MPSSRLPQSTFLTPSTVILTVPSFPPFSAVVDSSELFPSSSTTSSRTTVVVVSSVPLLSFTSLFFTENPIPKPIKIPTNNSMIGTIIFFFEFLFR